jgi:hypothetical protein
MDLSKVELHICTPMYGGMCTGMFTMSMINVMHQSGLSASGIKAHFSYLSNESLITRARNVFVDRVLKSNATHLMFIDADIGGFTADDIEKMIIADKDIICGIYNKKEINWNLVSDAVKHGIPPEELSKYAGLFVAEWGARHEGLKVDEPIEINAAGTGFMLIKREVFDKLEAVVPKYMNNNVANVQPTITNEFFDTSIDDDRMILLSEDYHFCKIAKKQGFSVYAAPWVKLIHVGTYHFQGELPTHK